MSNFFRKNNKKVSMFILILIFLMTIGGCQGYKNEIGQLETKNEELVIKNEELYNKLDNLQNEFEEYKDLMEPYEKLHYAKQEAVEKIKNLNFINNKSELIAQIEDAASIEVLNKKIDEIRKLEKDAKDEYIAELTNEVQSFTYLSEDKKKEIIEDLSNKTDKSSMHKTIKENREENNRIAKEKEEALKKEQASNNASIESNMQSNSSGVAGNVGGSVQSVGSTQTAPKEQGQVLVTPTGSKYHSRACGRGTYSPISLSDAKARGLTPCKKCY